MKVFWKWCFFFLWFFSVWYGYIRCNLGIWYGYDDWLLKKNIPVRYDMRQNQPALYQDQSGVTWGNTSLIPGPVRCDMRQYQSYTRTSQVWHEAIPVLYQDQSGMTWGNTNLTIPVPDWYEIPKESRHPLPVQIWPDSKTPWKVSKFWGAVWTVAHECLGFHSFNE
jgi:hypothetical protein